MLKHLINMSCEEPVILADMFQAQLRPDEKLFRKHSEESSLLISPPYDAVRKAPCSDW